MSSKKVAVVVGGGQTLGAFLATGLAEEGYQVAVADLNEENAIKTADVINQKCGRNSAKGFKVDATNEQSVVQLASAVDRFRASRFIGVQRWRCQSGTDHGFCTE